VHNLTRPAVSRDKRRRVLPCQGPPPLLPGPAQRQVGAHGQEPLEALRRVHILGRRRHDTHGHPVQAHKPGGCQETRRGRVARPSRGQGHGRDDPTGRRRTRAGGTAMLPRVVDRPRRDLHGPRRRHLDLGPGRLDLALDLGLGCLALVPATSTTTGPPPGDKVGTADGGPGSGSHGDKVCTSGTTQGGGGTHVRNLPHAGVYPSPLSYPGRPASQPQRSSSSRATHAREPVGPGVGTDGSQARTPPHGPARHRRVVTRRRLGNRLGWPGTVHTEKGDMSHYESQPTPLGWPGGRWCAGRRN